MALFSPQVDDDDKSDLDDDELEAINAAGAGGQTTGDGNATTNAGDATTKDTEKKSVRMNIGGEQLTGFGCSRPAQRVTQGGGTAVLHYSSCMPYSRRSARALFNLVLDAFGCSCGKTLY